MDPDSTRRERLSASYRDEKPSKVISHNYSRLVRLLRVLLPLLALGVMTILFFSSERDMPALPIERIEVPKLVDNKPVIEKNELVKPEFESQTKDGKTYRITATNATQEVRQPDLILLDQPRGTLEGEPAPIQISADSGTYNQKTQFMTLNQNVTISQEDQATITMTSLEADMKNGVMMTPHPLDITSTYGTLHASAMQITNDGMTITFKGPAKVVMTEGLETWLD